MQDGCGIYVDPEEDEVFFGCVSEREKAVCAKLANSAGSITEDIRNLCEVFDEDSSVVSEKIENVVIKDHSSIAPEVFTEGIIDLTESQVELKDLEDNQNSCKSQSRNTSVELEHNYSTPMKHKIDKSILTTPKSVVKADKDGGFLKVLSEIALVKAEAEGEKKFGERGEDEDKENKQISSLPEIKITEATPEKGGVHSPPKCINTKLRKFRIIYNSPQKEENVESRGKSSRGEMFESEKNYKNKCLDAEKLLVKDGGKSIELIDLNDFPYSGDLNETFLLDSKETQTGRNSSLENGSVEMIPGEKECKIKSAKSGITGLRTFEASADERPPNDLRFSKEARKILEVLKKSSADDTLNLTIPEINVEEEDTSFLLPEPVPVFDDTVIPNSIQPGKSTPKTLTTSLDKPASKAKTTEKELRKLTPVASESKLQPLKCFSERRVYNLGGNQMKSKCVKKLPLEDKWPTTEVKVNRVKPVEPSAAPSSKIPVFGAKNLKIPPNERVMRTPLAKTTLTKTPSGRSLYKTTKFNHVESPINAYIHNKPTSLVLNVKPEIKKDSATKVLKAAQMTRESEKKIREKTQKQERYPDVNAVKLPFVDYKNGTAYKVEKLPESRLPRLAPTMMKLIGNHSPKVLRHEGRFYMNMPRKQNSTENSTIVADPSEVSLVVSQPVQKSNTIK